MLNTVHIFAIGVSSEIYQFTSLICLHLKLYTQVFDAGAIGLTEDPAALRRWTVAGPEFVDEISASIRNAQVKKPKHYAYTYAAQKDFFDKVARLQVTISEMSDPFEEESTDLYALDTKDIVDIKGDKLWQQFLVQG